MSLVIFILLVLLHGFPSIIMAKKYGFLLGDEGWTTVGYGSIEHRPWIMSSMSHFILGREERVNVDARNRDDKDLWYFQSPLITLEFRPTLLMFSMMSFSGDFRRPNRVQALVRLRFEDGTVAEFPVYEDYDGSGKTFYVQFIEDLWTIINDDAPTIINDDAPTIILSDAPTIINDDAPTIINDDAPTIINDYNALSRPFIGHWYKHPFRLEILGDWTQGWETIGLDNVEII
jgi:hypothetical protein